MKNDVEILSTKDVARILKCCLVTARTVMHRTDFPLLCVGRELKVEKAALYEWLRHRHI